MRTIADKYIDEGIEKGIVLGMEKGIEQGISQGVNRRTRELIINMLKKSADLKFIVAVTGYTQAQIRTIQVEEKLL